MKAKRTAIVAIALVAAGYAAYATTTHIEMRDVSTSASTWMYASHPDLTQPTGYDCVPAASAMAIDSMGGNVTTLGLAWTMRTNFAGTTWPNMRNTYNAVQPKGWKFDHYALTNPNDVVSWLAKDIGAGVALPEGVLTNKLPYLHIDHGNGHEVVVDGVNTVTEQVRIFDPLSGLAHGHHVLSAEQFFNVLQGPTADSRWVALDTFYGSH